MYVGAFPLHLQLHEFLEVQAYFLLFNPLLDWLSLLYYFLPLFDFQRGYGTTERSELILTEVNG